MKNVIEKIKSKIIKYKYCAYCGKKLSWRFIWNVSLSIVHTDSPLGIALDHWPKKWRTINPSPCSCDPRLLYMNEKIEKSYNTLYQNKMTLENIRFNAIKKFNVNDIINKN